MKNYKKLLAAFIILTMSFGTAVYASFPVKKQSQQTVSTEMTTQAAPAQMQKEIAKIQEVAKADKQSKAKGGVAHDDEFWITLALWFFLGAFAAHRWYKGKPVGWNILFILTAGGCGVWAIVDLIHILQGKF